MLLLNQQMYWLDWNQIEDPQIAEYKSNCNFLEANNHVNDIVYTKAKLISNINLVENAMFRSDHEYNCHEYHSYDRVLKDSIVKEGKKRYSLQELQTLFQNYYPYVYSLVNYWETKIPDKIYKDFTNKLNSDFEELCLNLSLKKHQINEKNLSLLLFQKHYANCYTLKTISSIIGNFIIMRINLNTFFSQTINAQEKFLSVLLHYKERIRNN